MGCTEGRGRDTATIWLVCPEADIDSVRDAAAAEGLEILRVDTTEVASWQAVGEAVLAGVVVEGTASAIRALVAFLRRRGYDPRSSAPEPAASPLDGDEARP